MDTSFHTISHCWATLFFEELARQGVQRCCIAPGSRSTPLTLAAAANPSIETTVHIDERGLGFFALGVAKSTQKPVVMITTSGTAVANLYPALMEAANSDIPLILVSADRPAELKNIRANQTMTQAQIFSDLNDFMAFPEATTEIPPSYALAQAVEAATRATQPGNPGPVHVNWPVREPLLQEKRHNFSAYLDPISWWMTGHAPYKQVVSGASHPDLSSLLSFLDDKKALVLVGELVSDRDREAVIQFCSQANLPVLADVSSGIRGQLPFLKPYYPQVSDWEVPEVIIQIGGRMTAKHILEQVRIWGCGVVQLSSISGRLDPVYQVRMQVVGDLVQILDDLGSLLKVRSIQVPESKAPQVGTDWCAEGVVRQISSRVPSGWGVFLSNSLPIRLWDEWADPSQSYPVFVNRGVSGIDGIMASAAGVATGLNKGVLVVIGDLAFLHDLNSLALLQASEVPIGVVILNNGGGGIFSKLPHLTSQPEFETYFKTPQSIHFESCAAGFDLPFGRVATVEELNRELVDLNQDQKTKIVEVRV